MPWPEALGCEPRRRRRAPHHSRGWVAFVPGRPARRPAWPHMLPLLWEDALQLTAERRQGVRLKRSSAQPAHLRLCQIQDLRQPLHGDPPVVPARYRGAGAGAGSGVERQEGGQWRGRKQFILRQPCLLQALVLPVGQLPCLGPPQPGSAGSVLEPCRPPLSRFRLQNPESTCTSSHAGRQASNQPIKSRLTARPQECCARSPAA